MSKKFSKKIKKIDRKITKAVWKHPKATAVTTVAMNTACMFLVSDIVYDAKRKKELAVKDPAEEKKGFISKLNPFKKKGKTTTKTTSTSDTVEETEEK
jgi:hypothetical protein